MEETESGLKGLCIREIMTEQHITDTQNIIRFPMPWRSVLQGWPKKWNLSNDYITLYERYHFFGPPCIIMHHILIRSEFI